MAFLIKSIAFIFIVFNLSGTLTGQESGAEDKKVYHLNYKIDVPIIVGNYALNFYGLKLIKDKPPLTYEEVNTLNKDDIWKFDRRAVEQTHTHDERARTVSDIGLWVGYCLPFLLVIDNEIRSRWYDVLLLYLQAQSINYTVYAFGGPVFTSRVRPLVYYEETSLDYKLSNDGTTDSFFSGHSSMVAGASFFMAKVLDDYHPELGGKKWLIYAAALIPPVFVGYHRYRGKMHFPTDIVLGTAIGAAAGVLVPHLHKKSRKNKDLSIVPFTGSYSGMVLSLKF